MSCAQAANDGALFGTDPHADGLDRVRNLFARRLSRVSHSCSKTYCFVAQELPNGAQLSPSDPARERAIELLQRLKKPGCNQAVQHHCIQPVFLGKCDVSDFVQKNVVVILWNFVEQLPHLNLAYAVRCILCNGAARLDGFSQFRRIFGLTTIILLAAKKYRCPCCPKNNGKATTFDAKHPVVMRRLPDCVKEMLPAVFTHSGAMATDMLQHIDHDVMNGVSISAAHARAVDFAYEQHNQAELQYLSLHSLMQQPGQQTVLTALPTADAPPQFPQFGHASIAKQYLSSGQYCSTVWLEWVRDRASYAQRLMSTVLGRFLCCDHTFRVAKYVRKADGSKAYLAVLSFTNEFGEIVAYYFTHTTSLLEVKEGLQKIAQRYKAAGQPVSSAL